MALANCLNLDLTYYSLLGQKLFKNDQKCGVHYTVCTDTNLGHEYY